MINGNKDLVFVIIRIIITRIICFSYYIIVSAKNTRLRISILHTKNCVDLIEIFKKMSITISFQVINIHMFIYDVLRKSRLKPCTVTGLL